jgi:hypothetical protein
LEVARGFHHFVDHAAEEESIGPLDVLARVTMQFFIRDHRGVIAAAVQGDVDGISKGRISLISLVWPANIYTARDAVVTSTPPSRARGPRASPLGHVVRWRFADEREALRMID